MSIKVLVVEDEPALLDTLEYNLIRQGYMVETAKDGQAALSRARLLKPDLIVLDIMLPYLDGFEVCRILRQEMNAPILMLTARDAEVDRVVGLEIGADDYLTKPFSMREFLARVKAQLRRVRLDRTEVAVDPSVESETLVSGNLLLNVTRHEAFMDGQPLSLKPKEFELLLYLVRHQGQVISRDLLLERVWGWSFTGGSRTVDVHMRWLREKIEALPARPNRLITVRGVGYRFEG
ncbi:MAG TPA: response regulator transcription factor [Anaerolineales bacterium]|nr:response regulator transcription factor [Anaerolineales bacterium]